jgi:enoyl-CoA hydratase/carnithine racemase
VSTGSRHARCLFEAAPKRQQLLLAECSAEERNARRKVVVRQAIAVPAASIWPQARTPVQSETVPRRELDAAVDRWVADVLVCAPLSLRAIKQVVRRTAQLTAAEAQALRLPAVIAALRSHDAEEGVAAFREKRPPLWEGG